jgi:hypothetical protein
VAKLVSRFFFISVSFEAFKNWSGSLVHPVKWINFTRGIRKRRGFGGGNFVVQK